MMRVENTQGIAWFNAVDDRASVNHGKLRVDLFPDKPDALGHARHESLDLSESEAVELRDYLNKSYPVEVKK
ncbi:hypothetical protein [Psychrobacter sp.]|uniref:hypothetical protein n=1 Tax=Psychrobacter sp. TaxID=56811 RepID=UPI0035634005